MVKVSERTRLSSRRLKKSLKRIKRIVPWVNVFSSVSLWTFMCNTRKHHRPKVNTTSSQSSSPTRASTLLTIRRKASVKIQRIVSNERGNKKRAGRVIISLTIKVPTRSSASPTRPSRKSATHTAPASVYSSKFRRRLNRIQSTIIFTPICLIIKSHKVETQLPQERLHVEAKNRRICQQGVVIHLLIQTSPLIAL